MLTFTFGALVGQGHTSAAPMTAKLSAVVGIFKGMVGHRNATGGTAYCLSTASAAYEIVVAAPIEEEDRLLVPCLYLNKSFGKKSA